MKHIRSLLCIPAHKPELFAKGVQAGADMLMFDLEDSVPPQHKAQALANVQQYLGGHQLAQRIAVRFNPESFVLERAALTGLFEYAVIPKVRHMTDLTACGEVTRCYRLMPVIETPQAVVHLREIARLSAGLIFGVADYAAGMGVSDRLGLYGAVDPECAYVNERFAYAKQKIATYAAANGIPAFDTCFRVKGEDAEDTVRYQWSQSRSWGFTAGAAIHPMQVRVANEVFDSQAEHKWAAQTHASFAAQNGEVHCDDYGMVVGRPVDRQARAIIASGVSTDLDPDTTDNMPMGG